MCGLPRSGTTILMKSLYETGKFASLTYRDMPFYFMSKYMEEYIKENKKKEKSKIRIHADDIEIDIDSPEALEEVFGKAKFIRNTLVQKIFYHDVDNFTTANFKNLFP